MNIIKIRQLGSRIEYDCSSKGFDAKKFLGLNHSYSEIIESIKNNREEGCGICQGGQN